ncbi:MAG: hypothetical protein ABGX27_02585 [Desulfurobacteriaceae bacterium]
MIRGEVGRKKGGYIAIAELEKEDGSFHSNNEGIFHFGFSEDEIKKLYEEVGFKDIKIVIVNVIHKNNRDYPIFLALGRK